ncbi:hypothetical protein niasHT_002976 [Heterodera trifolii]|uniref:Uncharacterized protein n=1 Tax=Heterodera trifolii TaxID=157864 RepID=A0ABD2LP41_9BILA
MINRSSYLTRRQAANAGIVLNNEGVALQASPPRNVLDLNQRRSYLVDENDPPLFRLNRSALISPVTPLQNPNNSGSVLENEMSEDELRRLLLNVDLGRRNNDNQQNGNAPNDDQQNRGGQMENEENGERRDTDQMALGNQLLGGLRDYNENLGVFEIARNGQQNLGRQRTFLVEHQFPRPRALLTSTPVGHHQIQQNKNVATQIDRQPNINSQNPRTQNFQPVIRQREQIFAVQPSFRRVEKRTQHFPAQQNQNFEFHQYHPHQNPPNPNQNFGVLHSLGYHLVLEKIPDLNGSEGTDSAKVLTLREIGLILVELQTSTLQIRASGPTPPIALIIAHHRTLVVLLVVAIGLTRGNGTETVEACRTVPFDTSDLSLKSRDAFSQGAGMSFRGTVNYLLALCSFFELLHQHGHFLFLYTALSGLNFIEYRLAAKIMSVSAFGIGGILPTMFFTGIDRLIGIGFDEMHYKLVKRPYLALITSVSALFGIIASWLLYQEGQQYGDEMITGCIVDLFKFNQRAFRSLLCIIGVNIGGYLISFLIAALTKQHISSSITVWFIQIFTGALLNIGAASPAPILYFTSTEYRQAFKTVFPFVFKRISNVIQVMPLQSGPTFGTTAQC